MTWLRPADIRRRSKSKQKNVKTEIDGIKFASKGEAERYCYLRLLVKAGQIRDLELQPRFELQAAFQRNGVRYPSVTYVADFSYIECDTGRRIVEDFKGQETDIFKLKKRLFLATHKPDVFRISTARRGTTDL